LVLMIFTVAISSRSYVNLHSQFDNHRQDAHKRFAKDIEALIDQSLNRLRQLGSMIPSLAGMQHGFTSGEIESIRRAFEPEWPVLQFDLGIDVIGFYDTLGRLMVTWEAADWSERSSPKILDWVKRVIEGEVPVTALSCSQDCQQYAIIPILARGQCIGALSIRSSLADVVSNFHKISGNDIGVIVTDMPGVANDEQSRLLSRWNAQILALTNLERNLKIIKKAADEVPLEVAIGGVNSTVEQRSYEISLFSLSEFVGDNKAFLVVIADITDTLEEIRDATKEIVIVAVIGWLLAELLLLAILWKPMSRLRLTAKSLPMLAQSQFNEARTIITRQARHNLLNDEIDILDDTAIALADRLERLEHKVEEHTQALSRRMEDLAKERDFIASLLDMAQVVILTQDGFGRIVRANPFTYSLTNYQEQEIIGRNFIDLLFPGGSAELSSKRLREELTSSKLKHLRHESLMSCKDGSIRNITWYHSRLNNRSEDDPVILSVGLDITERRGAELRLAWMADHDTLTNLMNRRRFQEELELALTAAQRHGKTGALLLIDLDHFKYINDTCGHHSGDALLKLVAEALCGECLTVDVVARLGGDEFAILVRETDAAGAIEVAKEVQSALGGVNLAVDGQTLGVTASIGIVLFPTHANNVGDILAEADLAMYQAKEGGRGYWQMFSENDETRERIRDRVYWKEKVSHAIAEDRFVLYFQPIVEINSGLISHYEVLLRMRDEQDNIIGPSLFIETAERGGMIHVLDRMVISKAIGYLAFLETKGYDVTFAINLSGHAFSDPQLLPHLRWELEHNRVNTAKVIFEITETAAVADFTIANNMMLAIKEFGCRFALDDFGIGFSSFYYLKHLPIDYLKIDGAFIRQLTDSLDDQIIVRAMSQVASGFGKKTIAEYVETQFTLELLREYGIDFAQGYLISKPLSAEETFPLKTTWKEKYLL
jgi:diguanylate cyclase (GGDEF)-like protein/PAS domain S-box-containing protein